MKKLAGLAPLLVSASLAMAGSEFPATLQSPLGESYAVPIAKDAKLAERGGNKLVGAPPELLSCAVASGTRVSVDKDPGTWAWRVRVEEGPEKGCIGVVSSQLFRVEGQRSNAITPRSAFVGSPTKPDPGVYAWRCVESDGRVLYYQALPDGRKCDGSSGGEIIAAKPSPGARTVIGTGPHVMWESFNGRTPTAQVKTFPSPQQCLAAMNDENNQNDIRARAGGGPNLTYSCLPLGVKP
jgi:hypothetical protein